MYCVTITNIGTQSSLSRVIRDSAAYDLLYLLTKDGTLRDYRGRLGQLLYEVRKYG